MKKPMQIDKGGRSRLMVGPGDRREAKRQAARAMRRAGKCDPENAPTKRITKGWIL